MRYGSVCSGIEAATVAWHGLGWQPVYFSEIEAFPSAVLAHHYPDVPNMGDMTKHKEWTCGPIDLLVGGTPCQSFSVAGLRKGLDDPRGSLMLTFLAIAERQRPRWIVWENVPGVLSSGGGRDFGSFLGALGHLGYGWAYRVLDAQWFGVAQRRRRVFVVGCLGDQRAAAAVLFERESVRRDPAPSREKGQGVAHDVAPCIGASGRGFARTGETRGQDPVVATGAAGGLHATVGALCADAHPGAYSGQDAYTGRLVPVQQPLAFSAHMSEPQVDAGLSQTLQRKNPQAVAIDLQNVRCGGDVAGTLDTTRPSRGGKQAIAVRTAQTSANGHGIANDVAHTLDQVQGQAVAFTKAKRAQSTTDDESWVAGQVAPTMNGFDTGDTRAKTAIVNPLCVRRLTPRECERLQGFPDDYTAIPYRGKAAADGPRYKALGNSMAVPVMRWIGERITAAARPAAVAPTPPPSPRSGPTTG